jgi:hypothetical protein
VFTTRGEKKTKLANVMVDLLTVREPERQINFDAIIEAYNDRSWLVHSGKQDLSKYIVDSISEKRESQSLLILDHLMANILTKFPDWYFEISNRSTPVEYLNEWQDKIKLLLPNSKQYNIIQKVLIWMIEGLKKVGKIDQE